MWVLQKLSHYREGLMTCKQNIELPVHNAGGGGGDLIGKIEVTAIQTLWML